MFIFIACNHDHPMLSHLMHRLHILIQIHHTESQEEVQVAIQEEQAGTNPQEIQAQEVPEAEEQGEDLPECVDHQPSSFEQGKPRSISLPTVCKLLILCLLCLMH
jgi:hypothetical protein